MTVSRILKFVAFVALMAFDFGDAVQAHGSEWAEDVVSGCRVWDERQEFNGKIVYSGDCIDDKAHGKGVLNWSGKHFGNGSYEGEFKFGKFEGKGVYTAHNDLHYEGEFKSGNFNGQGSSTQPGQPTYKGSYKSGVPHGEGTWKDYTGDTYVGFFSNGKRHGQGRFVWARSGLRYEGPWNEGKMDGRGMFVLPNGEKKTAIHDHGDPKVDWSDVPIDHDRQLCRFFATVWGPANKGFRQVSERVTGDFFQRQVALEFEFLGKDDVWRTYTAQCIFELRNRSKTWKLVEGHVGETKYTRDVMRSFGEIANVILFAVYPEKFD